MIPIYSSGGGGGIVIDKDHYFANNAARDAYFPLHLNELISNSDERTYIGVGDLFERWDGLNDPANYSDPKWTDVTALVAGKKGDKGADGNSTDLALLKDGELPVFDAKLNKLVPSGVKAEDGDITIAPSSIHFGNHKMSSIIEGVIFTNKDTDKKYAPLWQEVAPFADKGYVRAYSKLTDVTRVPLGNIDVTNPSNKNVTVDADEAFFGGEFVLSQAATNVEMYILDANDKEVWRDKLGDLASGAHTVTFKDPMELKDGYIYSIFLRSIDGSDVIAKSNAVTGFSWFVSRATFQDEQVTLNKDIGDVLTDTTLVDGSKLQITHYDGAKHLIQLPVTQELQPIDLSDNLKMSIANVLQYKDRTLIASNADSSLQSVLLPLISNMGVSLRFTFVNNKGEDKNFTISAAQGDLIATLPIVAMGYGESMTVELPLTGRSWVVTSLARDNDLADIIDGGNA